MQSGDDGRSRHGSYTRMRAVIDDDVLAGMRALLVDDDLAYTRSLRNVLVGWGCHVVVVSEPAAALDAVVALDPHVVLLDYDLPGASGDQVARVIQGLVESPPPVFLISGSDLTSIGFPIPGVLRVFRKPFEPVVLRDALADLRAAPTRRTGSGG